MLTRLFSLADFFVGPSRLLAPYLAGCPSGVHMANAIFRAQDLNVEAVTGVGRLKIQRLRILTSTCSSILKRWN